MDDSYYDKGTAASYELEVQGGSQTTVTVRVHEAHGLKALYYSLHYDPGKYAPLAAEATGELSSGTDPKGQAKPDLIQLTSLGQPGLLQHGQVLVHPDNFPGFSGSAALARVTFAPRPFDGQRRASAVPPTKQSSQSTLAIDNDNGTLSWSYYNSGDYNQNGLVEIADLTPLGVHLGESVTGGPETIQAVIDGDGNHLITLSDLTPIGANIGTQVEKYYIQQLGELAGYPEAAAGGKAGLRIGQVDFSSSVGDRTSERLHFSFFPEDPQEADFTRTPGLPPPDPVFYVVPAVDETTGVASTPAEFKATNLRPAALLAASPISGPAPLSVEFDAAASHDPDGSIVQYEFDFDGPDGALAGWSDNGSSPAASHVYTDAGRYTCGLRVTDDKGRQHTAYQEIEVLGAGGNVPPEVNMAGDLFLGSNMPPREVNFATSATDSDGAIGRYEWDLDGDGVFEYESTPQDSATYTFEKAGIYRVTVRVWDLQGAFATDSELVRIGGYIDTVQLDEDLLTVDHVAGSVPFSPIFSADTDHSSFKWDFDNDGVTDLDSGAQAVVQHTYTDPGPHFCHLWADGTPALIMVVALPQGSPDNSIVAFPLRTTAYDGERVPVIVYSNNTLAPLDRMNIRLTCAAGNNFLTAVSHEGSLLEDAGLLKLYWRETVLGTGSQGWTVTYPSDPVDLLDGRWAYDFYVSPDGGDNPLMGTGVLLIVNLEMHASTAFGFDVDTHYENYQGNWFPHDWADLSNAGMPSIEVY